MMNIWFKQWKIQSLLQNLFYLISKKMNKQNVKTKTSEKFNNSTKCHYNPNLMQEITKVVSKGRDRRPEAK